MGTNEMLKLKGFNFNNLVKVKLKKKASIIEETLTRLGIGDHGGKILWPTCHLIKVDLDWYIIHYKEVYGLRGRDISWRDGDLERRNEISNLLEEWGMIEILNPSDMYFSHGRDVEVDGVKIYKIKHDEKKNYEIKKKIDIDELKEQLRLYNDDLRDSRNEQR